MKISALIIFITTYIGLLTFQKKRKYVALAAAAATVIAGIIPLKEMLSTIDFNVLMMITGTMGIVSLFIKSGMPALLADILIRKTKSVKWAIITLSLFAGVISAFVDNVATVLMVAPIAINIAKKLKISPVKSIIAIAVASNLQGVATLVGDTTSIMLGGYANMDFLDFFIFKGKMGLFWIVQLGALAATVVLIFAFRKDTQKISHMGLTIVDDYIPTCILSFTILLLIFASFIPASKKPSVTSGAICVVMMIVGIIYDSVKNKSIRGAVKIIKDIDYDTLLLLSGLFIVIGGLTHAGVVQDIGNLFVKFSGNNVFLIYTILVWASVLFSAFIDNIPYVATMLPVTQAIGTAMGINPTILYFGLLTGATLGGNLTPIGASANITATGILKRAGYEVKSSEFMKISVPFTLTAVFTGYVLVWLTYKSLI
ncbi:MAG: TRAP transporter large permease subunit [Clostridia bacterium]|nr:TRAP transporter large permease subunit [Clostridia bacterium]